MKFNLADIVRATDSQLLRGDDSYTISGVNSLDNATATQLAFCIKSDYLPLLSSTKAGAIITSQQLAAQIMDKASNNCAILSAKDGELAYLEAMKVFAPRDLFDKGVSPQATIAADAKIGKGVSLGAASVIGSGCVIGDNCQISNGVSIAADVRVGNDCIIHANVSIYRGSEIHNRVILHSNCVIGGDGFGYIKVGKVGIEHKKIPHNGGVVLEDDVEIGANSAVDRATMGVTRIGAGTKIDNLVQIAHNVIIGKRCIICGNCGIGGSAQVGDDCVFAGKSGCIDNVKVGNKTTVYAGGIVVGDTPEGSHIQGVWGRDRKRYLREMALLRKLPQLFKRIKNSTKE